MFSKQLLIIIWILILIVITIVILSITGRNQHTPKIVGGVTMTLVAPIQKIVIESIKICRNIWRNYFHLVNVAHENEILKDKLSKVMDLNDRLKEIELSNKRLRNLLHFQKSSSHHHVIAAEVIGRDPSHWSKTMIIDKGSQDGVKKGLPVVVHSGIVGQVVFITKYYSKVLLLIDHNSSVDAIVRRTRSHGVIKGNSEDEFRFLYVLRKENVKTGDIVISSGLDGVFPKGLRVGTVSEILKTNSGMFQIISVSPFVDYEKIEEVLVICKSDKPLNTK